MTTDRNNANASPEATSAQPLETEGQKLARLVLAEADAIKAKSKGSEGLSQGFQQAARRASNSNRCAYGSGLGARKYTACW